MCHKFFFLQFTGPDPWYFLMHNDNDFENNIDCVAVIYEPPEGNESLITTDVYDLRLVHNIQFRFTGICDGKTKL
jgi:hypothetical protein